MNRITKFLIVSFLFITPFLKAQEYTNIDFSQTNITVGNWNNMVQTSTSQTGMTLNLINDAGTSTGAVLTITDSFNLVNTGGTTTPDPSLPFPSTATADSFYGNDVLFANATEPTGGMEFTLLNPAKYYSFKVFASRTGVTDNREALYTFTGLNTLSGTLDASNNTANIAKIYNVLPDANGKITLSVQKGPNNNNSSGFYYLGAIQMITTDTEYSDPVTQASIEVVYPNGSEIWHATSTPYISWTSQGLTEDVSIQYSIDNGTSWLTIATVASTIKKYTWTVPYNVSSQCKVRVVSGATSDESDTTFSIISNTNNRFKIVVLGSSTAAGAGPSSVDQAWVWLYRDYLTQHDTRYEVTNLAVGGYTTYDILPTGTTIPSGVNETIDTYRNVTKAIELGAEGIIVNMPSNDSNMGYSANDQMTNYHTIVDAATAAGIPIWLCTVQPRNFSSGSTAQTIQLEMVTRLPQDFPTTYIDFWNGLANTSNGYILTPYDSGDGIHLNAAGHQILFQRVIGKDLHTTVKNADDGLSDVTPLKPSYLVDFNYNSTDTPSDTNSWNNWTAPIAVDSQLSNLISDAGVASTFSIKLLTTYGGAGNTGSTSPGTGFLYPASAMKDFLFLSGSGTFSFEISGLNPSKVYSFEIFASRMATATPNDRTTSYRVVGVNAATGTVNAESNNSNVALIEKIEPTAAGKIILNITKGETNTVNYSYINFFKMTESTPTPPQVLLDCENGGAINGTYYEVDALRMHVMANGAEESVNDFELVDNPNPSGINTSSKVMKFTRRTSSTSNIYPWAGFYASIMSGYDLPDLTVNKYVHVKVLKTRISPVWFKLETPGNYERASVNTQTLTNQWEDMVFNFSDLTGTFSTVALMPDRVSTVDNVGDLIIYFDDIVINDIATPTTVLAVKDNIMEGRVSVYPNPSKGTLIIDTLEELKSVHIYSLDGRQVESFKDFSVGTNTISIDNLSNGIYLVNFVAKNGTNLTKKIIKE